MPNAIRLCCVMLTFLFLGSGCAAWTAEKYGSHERVDSIVDSEKPSALSEKLIQPFEVKEVVVSDLCEPRNRKTPRVKGRKYVPVGSNPVDPGRYYNPEKEFLFYFPKDMSLLVEYGKEKKTVPTWIEEGAVGVADKATGRALRVCKCGNGIKTPITVRIKR